MLNDAGIEGRTGALISREVFFFFFFFFQVFVPGKSLVFALYSLEGEMYQERVCVVRCLTKDDCEPLRRSSSWQALFSSTGMAVKPYPCGNRIHLSPQTPFGFRIPPVLVVW